MTKPRYTASKEITTKTLISFEVFSLSLSLSLSFSLFGQEAKGLVLARWGIAEEQSWGS
jgi:hypothetical protein